MTDPPLSLRNILQPLFQDTNGLSGPILSRQFLLALQADPIDLRTTMPLYRPLLSGTHPLQSTCARLHMMGCLTKYEQ